MSLIPSGTIIKEEIVVTCIIMVCDIAKVGLPKV